MLVEYNIIVVFFCIAIHVHTVILIYYDFSLIPLPTDNVKLPLNEENQSYSFPFTEHSYTIC